MGKMSELDLALAEFCNAAQIIKVSADTIAACLRGEAPTESNSEEPKTITLEALRSVLADKSRSGHTDAIHALLEKHGAKKLSEIAKSEYAGLLAEVEALK